jgi:multimeric flavodoxin WrbA
MKIIGICGSPRNGETIKVLNDYRKKMLKLGDYDFEIMSLKDYNLKLCKGCLECFMKGEQFCPVKDDDRDLIVEKIQKAKGLVIALPVNSLHVPTIVKNLLDRLGYIFHRPSLFGITFQSIVTQGMLGNTDVIKYLNTVFHFWGCNTCPGIGLDTPPGKKMQNMINKIENKLEKGVRIFHKTISNTKPVIPSFQDVFIFRLQRTIKPYMEMMPINYEYYKEKGWVTSDYYYDVKLGYAKKIFGFFMDKQATRVGKKIKKEIN